MKKHRQPTTSKPNIVPPGQNPTYKNETVIPKNIGCPGLRKFKLSQLKASEYNPRIIDNDTMQGLTNSIKHFGCVEPIIVNIRRGLNIIIGGHQRYKALKSLGAKECICVTVNCNKTEEKLLNLTLNNPRVQGKFIDGVENYINELQEQLPVYLNQLDLQIDQLREQIAGKEKNPESLEYKDEKIKPYKRTHVLLSFEPMLLVKILPQLQEILKIPGVEYEQGSN